MLQLANLGLSLVELWNPSKGLQIVGFCFSKVCGYKIAVLTGWIGMFATDVSSQPPQKKPSVNSVNLSKRMEFIIERSLFFCNARLAGHFTDRSDIYLFHQGPVAGGAAYEKNVIGTKPGLYVLGMQME